jgi:hypothetical protein
MQLSVVSPWDAYQAYIDISNNARVHSIAQFNMICWVGLLPCTDCITTPSRYRLISFISFPFHWAISSYDLYFSVRSWSAGTNNPNALHLLNHLCVFMKRKIHFWWWPSMPISYQLRRSGFGRSHMIQGLCWNTLNPLWTWHDESSALVALVLASLSILDRLWFHRRCCLSKGT